MTMKKLIFFSFTALLLASCGGETGTNTPEKAEAKKADRKEELHNQIQRLEGEMHRTPQLDNILAGQAVKAYDDYASLFPDDSLSPDYLFKAAEISTAIKQYPQAVAYYQNIISNFSKFRLIQECYFLEATVYDQYLNDDKKAKEVYESLIAEYPSSPYVPDAQAAISNLGKTDEELIREFERKNKGK
jgi:outer membrane protein assembly factor BamD (BamD/ComL family)